MKSATQQEQQFLPGLIKRHYSAGGCSLCECPFTKCYSDSLLPGKEIFFLPAELYSQTGVKPPNPSSNNSSTCHLPDSPAAFSPWWGGVDLDQYGSFSCFLYLRHFSFLNFLSRSNFPSSCPPFIIYCFCSSLFSTLYSVFNSLSFDPLHFSDHSFTFSPYLSPFSTLTFPWIFLSSCFLTCTAFFHLLLFFL